MHRLLVRTIPRASEPHVTYPPRSRAAAHVVRRSQPCRWYNTDAVTGAEASADAGTPPPVAHRVPLPPLPSFVASEVAYPTYISWVSALQQNPIFSWRTYRPEPREPGFSVPYQNPQSEQENLALLRRFCEVCEVTKGSEALSEVVQQTRRVLSYMPDRELGMVVAALLAAGKDAEVSQLMEAFKKSGTHYVQPWEEVLEYYAQKRQLSTAQGIAQYLLDTVPSFRAVHTIIAVLAHTKDIPALQLLLRKYEHLLHPSRLAQCEEVIGMLQENRPPDDWPLSHQIWQLVERRDVEAIIAELQKPGMEGISEGNFVVLMRKLASQVGSDAWHTLQAFLIERGIHIGEVEFYNGRIDTSELQRAISIVDDMDTKEIARNIGTYDALIYVAGSNGDLQLCRKTLEEISAKKVAPAERSFSAILDLWRSQGNFANIMQFWDDVCRLQIPLPPITHRKVQEVIYVYASKLDAEARAAYPHVDMNDIPAVFANLQVPQFNQPANIRTTVFENAKQRDTSFNPAQSGDAKFETSDTSFKVSTPDGFADYMYQEGTSVAELQGFLESNLENLPPKTMSTFIPTEIRESEAQEYDTMLRNLRESNKDTSSFLNKAMTVFRGYTRRWFNHILLDAAHDEVEFTSEGYGALVYRAWNAGDHAECERLLAKMATHGIPETEETAQIRAELRLSVEDKPRVLRALLDELQKQKTELDISKVQGLAKLVALNFAGGAELESALADTRAQSQPHGLADTHAHTQSHVPTNAKFDGWQADISVAFAELADVTAAAAGPAHSATDTAQQHRAPKTVASAPKQTETAKEDPRSARIESKEEAKAESAKEIKEEIKEDGKEERGEKKQKREETKREEKEKEGGVSVAELIARMRETSTMEDRAKVWEFADKQFSEAKAFMFEKMITSLVQEDDLDGCVQLFNDMKLQMVQPTEKIFKTVINALAATADRTGEALDVLREAKKLSLSPQYDKESSQALARAAAAQDDTSTFSLIIEDMYSFGYSADPDILYILATKLAQEGDIVGSVKILEEITNAHKVDADLLFNSLVTTLTSTGNTEQRYKLVEEMAQRGIALNAASLNAILYELLRDNDMDASLLIVRELHSNGQAIDPMVEYAFAQSFYAEINAANDRNTLLRILAIIDEVGKGKQWVGSVVYGALILKLVQFGFDKRALQLYDSVSQHLDLAMKNAILAMLASRRSLRKRAETLATELRAAQSLNTESFQALVRMHVREGEPDKALAVVQEAHGHKHVLSDSTFDDLIKAYAGKLDHAGSLRVVEEMRKGSVLTPIALTILLRASVHKADTQGCVDAMVQLHEKNQLNTEDVKFVLEYHPNFDALVVALNRANRKLAERVLRVKEGDTEIPRVVEQTQHKEESNTETHGPLDGFADIVRAPPAEFPMKYSALLKALPAQHIQALLADMPPLDARRAHKGVLECAVRARDIGACVTWLRYAQENFQEIRSTTMAMLRSLLAYNFNEEVYNLTVKLVSKNSNMWNMLLQALLAKGDTERAGALMNEKDASVELSSRSREYLIKLLAKDGELGACFDMYKELITETPKKTEIISLAAGTILSTSARLKDFTYWDEVVSSVTLLQIPINLQQFTQISKLDRQRYSQLSSLSTNDAKEKINSTKPKTKVTSKSATTPPLTKRAQRKIEKTSAGVAAKM